MSSLVLLSSEFPGVPLGPVSVQGCRFTTMLLPTGSELLERLKAISETERASTRAIVSLLTDRLDQSKLSILKQRLPNLELLANYAVGFNNIDVAAAHALGIAVSNTPHVLGDATADLTLLLMLMVSRQVLPHALELQERGCFTGWAPRFGLGVDLAGRTLGLVGFGDIGRRVAMRACALGMKVITLQSLRAHTLHKLPVDLGSREENQIERLPEQEFLAQTDVLSFHCPLTPETRGWLNRERLSALKQGAMVINTARGEIVDESALANALLSGHLYGAGLDVFCGEPQLSDVLHSVPRLVVLPHLGSATLETRTAMGGRVLENLAALFNGKSPLPYQVHLS